MSEATPSSPILQFEGQYLSLYEVDHWQYAARPNATGVVGIFAITSDQQVIFVEQFRHPMQHRVLEICAGLVGDEKEYDGESLNDCASRELLEETGYCPGNLKLLMSSPTSAGMTDEVTHLFLATDCYKESDGGGVDGEEITTHTVPISGIDEFLSNCRSKDILIDFKIYACLGLLSEWKMLTDSL